MRRIKHRFLNFVCLLSLFFIPTAGRAENPWFIRINIPEYKLFLYRGTELYRTYPIAVGKPKTPSPIGEFRIVNKVVDPTWFPPNHAKPVPPGPNNPLGKYWMGLSIPGYGIHGNHSPNSIGNSASLGCFRMFNSDVEEIFHIVPVSTPVQIAYETVTAQSDGECLMLEIHSDIYAKGNRDNAVDEAIKKCDWPYEPHWQALQELLGRSNVSLIEVPRTIQIEGDVTDPDGFYWAGEVYVNWRKINGLAIDVKTGDFQQEFNDYLNVDQLNMASKGLLTFLWDPDTNLLEIRRQSAEENDLALY